MREFDAVHVVLYHKRARRGRTRMAEFKHTDALSVRQVRERSWHNEIGRWEETKHGQSILVINLLVTGEACLQMWGTLLRAQKMVETFRRD